MMSANIHKLRIIDSGMLFSNKFPGDWAINAYFPSIVEIGPNELLCVYRRGSAMYSDDGRIFQLRSTDNGQTWQDEGVVWDGKADPKTYWYAPVGLSRAPKGDVLLTGFRIHRPSPEVPFYSEETGTCLPEESILLRSPDAGRTWSPPEVIRKPDGMPLEITGCVVILRDGRWMIPFDTSKEYEDPKPLRPAVVGLCSKDAGRSWNEVVRVAGGPAQDKAFFHARLLVLEDGRVVAFPWTADATGTRFLSLHRVVSDVTAQTWSLPEPVGIQAQTSYPVDLGGQKLALVYTLRESQQPGIYAALSADEGRSWNTDHQVQIWDAYGKESIGAPRTATYPTSHDNIAYGAPHALRLSNGDILASFWAGQSGQMACRWCRLRAD